MPDLSKDTNAEMKRALETWRVWEASISMAIQDETHGTFDDMWKRAKITNRSLFSDLGTRKWATIKSYWMEAKLGGVNMWHSKHLNAVAKGRRSAGGFAKAEKPGQ